MVEAKGKNGRVRFDGQMVCIERKGYVARTTVGKGEKRIPISAITSVQYKPPGAFVNGYIEFSLGGGNENRSRFGSATRDASQNENAVVFDQLQKNRFEKLRAAIEAAIVASRAGVQVNVVPPAPVASPAPAPVVKAPVPQQTRPVDDIPRQIEQLAALRDRGILSDAEFTTKKTELLGRL